MTAIETRRPTMAPVDALIALLRELQTAGQLAVARIDSTSSDTTGIGSMGRGVTLHNLTTYITQFADNLEHLGRNRRVFNDMLECSQGGIRPLKSLEAWIDAMWKISVVLSQIMAGLRIAELSVRRHIRRATEAGVLPDRHEATGIGPDLYPVFAPENRLNRTAKSCSELRRWMRCFGLSLWVPDDAPTNVLVTLDPLPPREIVKYRKERMNDPPVLVLRLLPGISPAELEEIVRSSEESTPGGSEQPNA